MERFYLEYCWVLWGETRSCTQSDGRRGLSEVSKPTGSVKVRPEQEAAGPNEDPVPLCMEGPAAPWHFCCQGRGLS